MRIGASANPGRCRSALLIGSLFTAVLGLAPQVTAEAAAKKVTPYKAVDARLQVVDSGKATLSDGSTWEGESTEVWTGVKSPNPALITGPGVMTMTADASYIQTGFEIKTTPTGGTDDCSGPLEAISLPVYPLVAYITKAKKGFTAQWTINPGVPTDDCPVNYSSYLPEGYLDREKEKEKLGDKQLVLEVGGSETFTGDAVGVPFTHTMTWNGKVVLKRGAAVAGK
jgi:hypothetical protein